MNEYGEWTFESTITAPDNVRVHVTITVPVERTWNDFRETAELAQMAAGNAMRMVNTSQERCPF